MRNKEYRDSYVAAHVSNTIAAQISILREENGWTQKQLAEKAGMGQPRISALEDPNYDNVEVETLRRLASAFDVALTVRFVPFSELVGWAEEPKLEVPKFENDGLTSSADLSAPSEWAARLAGASYLSGTIVIGSGAVTPISDTGTIEFSATDELSLSAFPPSGSTQMRVEGHEAQH